jgi:hypothetical protein
MSSISESAVDPNELAELSKFSEAVYALLPKASGNADRAIVIDETLYHWQQTGDTPLKDLEPNELIYALGTLWGNMLVEGYNWRWSSLTFHEFNDWKGRAVVSDDGSLSILPFAYIHECLAGKDEVKISASFTALASDIIPKFPAKSFENVMHGLQRIVPRG